MLQIIHGAAGHLTLIIFLTVLYTEYPFRILRGPADKSCHPHPEHRSGTAEPDCSRYTDDVTGTHRCRKGSHQCLEMRYISFPLLSGLAESDLHCRVSLLARKDC